jgi:hypothetical protein
MVMKTNNKMSPLKDVDDVYVEHPVRERHL